MPDEIPVEISNTAHPDATPTGDQPVRSGEIQRLVQTAEPFLDLAEPSTLSDGTTAVSARPFQFSELSTLRRICTLTEFPEDAEVQIEIELGHTQCRLDGKTPLSPGSLVPLTSLASEPVDIFADGRLAARGEVVTLKGQPGIRIVEIL